MNSLLNTPGNRNPAHRLPTPDPLTMAYAARRIAARYNVSDSMARLVAELVGNSIGGQR